MTIELTDAGRNEYEALVRDAKRYRWLRASDRNWKMPHIHINEHEGGECFVAFDDHLDAVIDAAMVAHLRESANGP